MTRTISMVVALLAVVACSKDETEPAGQAKAVEAEKSGVAVVSANELGPQAKQTVTITTRSEDARSVFERGRELHENVRNGEAAEQFRRAIEMDPEFALAYAYLAVLSEDKNERDANLDKALELSGDVPKAERLLIEALAAESRGKIEEQRRLYEELRTRASKDYRVAMWVGRTARRMGDMKESLAAFQQAVALEPDAAEPYNDLAYGFLYDGQLDEAVESAQTYARLKPREPNPQDSLGEILMVAGKFEEAEAAFRKALDIEPGFDVAWEGVSLSHAYRRQWDEAIGAIEQAVKATEGEPMSLRYLNDLSWIQLAAGRKKAALATVARIEKLRARDEREPIKGGVQPLLRADLLLAAGDHRAARKEIESVLEGLDDESTTRGWALVLRAWAEVEGGKLPAAKQTLAELEAHAAKIDDYDLPSGVAFVRGLVALAGGDADAALAAFEKVEAREGAYYFQSRWQRAKALEALGKNAEAAALRDGLAHDYGRDFVRAYWRHEKLGGSGS